MQRGILVAILYALLLCVQQEGHRHELDHLRAQLAHAHEQALEAPADPCAECALLAGLAHAFSGPDAPSLAGPVAALSPRAWHTRAVTSSPVRYYAARAPPSHA